MEIFVHFSENTWEDLRESLVKLKNSVNMYFFMC